jgi:hypothetical protein
MVPGDDSAGDDSVPIRERDERCRSGGRERDERMNRFVATESRAENE